mgnify:CR=1 FL=1
MALPEAARPRSVGALALPDLTLDIVACGAGWCGIRVAENDTCAGTALKVDGGTLEGLHVHG